MNIRPVPEWIIVMLIGAAIAEVAIVLVIALSVVFVGYIK